MLCDYDGKVENFGQIRLTMKQSTFVCTLHTSLVCPGERQFLVILIITAHVIQMLMSSQHRPTLRQTVNIRCCLQPCFSWKEPFRHLTFIVQLFLSIHHIGHEIFWKHFKWQWGETQIFDDFTLTSLLKFYFDIKEVLEMIRPPFKASTPSVPDLFRSLIYIKISELLEEG